MKPIVFLLLLAGILVGLGRLADQRFGHGAVWETGRPAVVMEVLDPTLEPYAAEWKTEIARRFPNACGLLLHGDEQVEDEWIAHPTGYAMHVQKLVEKYQAKFPDRTIVLLACNVGHFKLNVPGVYYAKSSVWCHPDRATHYEDDPDFGLSLNQVGVVPFWPSSQPTTQPIPSWLPFTLPVLPDKPKKLTRWEREPDLVGNIFEFVTD